MTFFYDLNKKLDAIREKPELTHGQLNERDEGKHNNAKTGFKALADKAAKEYGSKAAGERVAGAVRNKMKAAGKLEERDMADEGNAFSKAVVDAKRDGVQPGEKIRVGGKEMPLKEKMSPAKQKSFAALAEPKDKITFADKIAGAKQEVDEMLGDVAAEAMKNAVGKMSHQARATMKHVDASDASPKVKSAVKKASADIKPGVKGYRDRAAALKAAGVKGAPGEVQEAHDDDDDWWGTKTKTHKTASGGTVTRHGGVTRHQAAPGHYGGYDPESHPDKDDDKPGTPAGEKRGKGRPKGTGKSIGAKGPSGKSKLMTREDDHDIEDQGEYDQEGEMAKGQLHTVLRNAKELHNLLGDNDNLPEWVQSKLAKIEGMMKDVSEYMQSEREQDDGEEELDEKAVSKKQQKFMGMVHAAQKGGKPASKEVAKVAKTMKKKDAEDFASTKHKGLPEKKSKKKEEVEETTVAGSVATSAGPANDPGAPKAKKSGGSMVFGKGVYEGAIAESFNKKLGAVLTEGMNINMTTDSEGHQSLTVTATDEDAAALADMLKMAGLGGSQESCSSCGESPCGCDHIDEELANSPTPGYSDADTMLNTLSGGLNGRKSSGQTTVPVVNRDPRRGANGPVAEATESRLWELYNRYETK